KWPHPPNPWPQRTALCGLVGAVRRDGADGAQLVRPLMSLATGSVALRPRSERLRAPLWSIVGLAAATVALHVRDPHVHGSWGLCPLYATTGIYCPGCGALRGVNDLTDAHLGQAAS